MQGVSIVCIPKPRAQELKGDFPAALGPTNPLAVMRQAARFDTMSRPEEKVEVEELASLDACLRFPAAKVENKDEALVKAARMNSECKSGCKI